MERAWIVTDDKSLASDFGKTFANGKNNVAESISTSRLREVKGGFPPTVFLDLRTRSDWDCLHTQIETIRSRDVRTLIGLVKDGIPSDYAALATRELSAAARIPTCEQALQDLIAARRPSPPRQGASAEVRCVEIGEQRFVCEAPEMSPIHDNLDIAARRDFTILLVGETGTGKTTLARIIHDLSPRRDESFVTMACGAMPNELLGSELFGHVKGAFTGADRTKPGKFDAADGGTILLDEIDVLGLEQQARLLRVIETGEFEPLGSNETRKVNARVIAAANRRLEDAIEDNAFRQDLFYRLNQVRFQLPPLRERRADIVPMALHIIEECSAENDIEIRMLHPDFLEILEDFPWPGNIRQLRNEVRRAVLFCRDGILIPDLLSPAVAASRDENRNGAGGNGSELACEVAHTEQEAIEAMLRQQKYNRAATARALGISRVTLYNKIRKYQIKIDDK